MAKVEQPLSRKSRMLLSKEGFHIMLMLPYVLNIWQCNLKSFCLLSCLLLVYKELLWDWKDCPPSFRLHLSTSLPWLFPSGGTPHLLVLRCPHSPWVISSLSCHFSTLTHHGPSTDRQICPLLSCCPMVELLLGWPDIRSRSVKHLNNDLSHPEASFSLWLAVFQSILPHLKTLCVWHPQMEEAIHLRSHSTL